MLTMQSRASRLGSLALLAVTFLALGGCAEAVDGGPPRLARGVQQTCDVDSQCAEGTCSFGLCTDPLTASDVADAQAAASRGVTRAQEQKDIQRAIDDEDDRTMLRALSR